MSTRVKFIIEADAGKLLSEQKRVLAGQDKIEQGFRDQAKASEDASRREARAAQKTADAYELAERTMNDAVRVRAGAYRRQAYGPAYALAPRPVAVAASAGVAAYGGAYEYRLARTEQEQFQRFTQARNLRELRRGERDFAAGAGLRGFQDRMASERWDRDKASGVRDYDIHDVDDRRAARLERANELRERRRDRQDAERQKRDAAAREDRRQRRRQLRESAGAAITGYLGGQYALNLAGDTVRGVGEHYSRIGNAAAEFEDEVGPLVSLNDDNLKNFRRVKEGILSTTITGGFVGRRREVTDSRYNFEQATEGISEQEKAELWQQSQLLTKVKGGSLDENATAVAKLWQNYGPQFKSVREAVSTMAFMEAEGSIDMAALAKELPDAMAVWSAYGKSLHELSAATTVVTRSMGDPVQAVTQIRNLPGRLPKADKILGIKTTGDTATDLDLINRALEGKDEGERGQLIKKIAEEQGAAALTILLRDREEFRAGEAKSKGTGGGYLFDLGVKRFEDPAYSGSERLKSIAAFKENIPAMAAQDPEALAAMELYEATRAGVEWQNRLTPWVTDEEKKKSVIAEIAVGGAGNRMAAITYEKLYEAAQMNAAGAPDRKALGESLFRTYQARAAKGEALGLKDADGTFLNADDGTELRRIYEGTGAILSPEQLAVRHGAEANVARWQKVADVFTAQYQGAPGSVQGDEPMLDTMRRKFGYDDERTRLINRDILRQFPAGSPEAKSAMDESIANLNAATANLLAVTQKQVELANTKSRNAHN